MTLQQIRYILKIAQCGSISRAAEELFIAQPHLSNTLRTLEKELNIVIFKRGHKGVTLTSQGLEFLEIAKPLLEQEEKILNLYAHISKDSPFECSISSQRYPFVIKSFINYFDEVNPNTFKIRIRETGMYNVINDVATGKSNIGIIFLTEKTKDFLFRFLTMKNIQFYEIIRITPCFFFRKTHPLASKADITIEEMFRYPYVSFEPDSSISGDFSEEFILKQIPILKKHFIINDRATMINILTNKNAFSIGTGVLPAGYAGPELISKPISNLKNQIVLGWIKQSNVTLPPSAKLLLIKIKEVVTENQPD